MNEKIIVLLHAVIFILSVSLVFVNSNISKEDTSIQTKEIEEKIISIDHLVGTCPRSRSCTYPTCALWSDINNDGVCDRS